MTLPLDELARLYERATKGEWHLVPFEEDNGTLAASDLSDAGFERAIVDQMVNGKPYVMRWRIVNDKGAWVIPKEVSDHPNFQLIVALHNSFPALLAAARQAQGYREALEKIRAGKAEMSMFDAWNIAERTLSQSGG